MKKLIQNKLKNQKGLTLIELLAVIVILAIIAAIAIPAIGGIIENSRVGAMKSDNLNAIAAAELFLLDDTSNPAKTTVTLEEITNLDTDGDEVKAGAPVYLNDVGSLKTFTYTVSGKLVTSTAVAGNMKLKTTSATKQLISAYANGTRGVEADTPVTAYK